MLPQANPLRRTSAPRSLVVGALALTFVAVQLLVVDARAQVPLRPGGGKTVHLYRPTGTAVTLRAQFRGKARGRISFIRVRLDAAGRRVPGSRARARCASGLSVCNWRQLPRGAGTWAYQAVFIGRDGRRKRSRIVVVHWTEPPPPPPPPPGNQAPPSSVTLFAVTQDGPTDPNCAPSAPTTAGGAGKATYTASYGKIEYEWSVPATISSAGATASLKVTVTPAPGSRLSGNIGMATPSEFGVAPYPANVYAFSEVGQGPVTASQNYTFTPTRAFVSGELREIRLALGDCATYILHYVGN